MKGINYIVDDSGKKRAVIIDLEKWGDFWEDVYDNLISKSRKNEPAIPWKKLKEELSKEKK